MLEPTTPVEFLTTFGKYRAKFMRFGTLHVLSGMLPNDALGTPPSTRKLLCTESFVCADLTTESNLPLTYSLVPGRSCVVQSLLGFQRKLAKLAEDIFSILPATWALD